MNYEVANYRLGFSKDWKYLCVCRRADSRIITCFWIPINGSPSPSYLTVGLFDNSSFYSIGLAPGIPYDEVAYHQLGVENNPSGYDNVFRIEDGTGIGIGDLRDCRQAGYDGGVLTIPIQIERDKITCFQRSESSISLYINTPINSEGVEYYSLSCS